MSPNPQPPREQLYRDAVRASLVGLTLNLVLGGVKAVGGWQAHSFALMADAVNSAGDVLTSLIALGALQLAQRPPSAKHPYGYTRAEAAAASNVAVIVLLSGLWLGTESLAHIGSHQPPPPAWALWIAAANVVLKEGIYRYKMRAGQRLGSTMLKAAAWDHRSDALSALAVLVGLGAARWLGPRAIYADELAALAVVALIVFASGSLFHSAFVELLDRQADDALVEAVRATAEATEGVEAIEKLFVRKSGLEYLVDVHVEVAADLTVDTAHRIGHRLKDRVLQQYPRVRDVLVHLEPHRG